MSSSAVAVLFQTSASSALTSGSYQKWVHLPSPLSLHLLGLSPEGVFDGGGIGFGSLAFEMMMRCLACRNGMTPCFETPLRIAYPSTRDCRLAENKEMVSYWTRLRSIESIKCFGGHRRGLTNVQLAR